MPNENEQGETPPEKPGNSQVEGKQPTSDKGNSDGGASNNKPSDSEAKLLKEVMTLKKELRSFQEERDRTLEQKKKEEGKIQELFEQEKAKTTSLIEKLKFEALKNEGILQGILDIDLLKLIDMSKIAMDNDNGFIGMKEAIEELKQKKPFLFGNPENGRVPPTPTPGKQAHGAGGFKTFDDYMRAAPKDRLAWKSKNPSEYAKLVEAAKVPKY